MRPSHPLLLISLLVLTCFSCQTPPPIEYDLLLTNATIYDGSGSAPVSGMVAINADTIAAIGDLANVKGKEEIDVKGLAVSPGFINMLSWATVSLLQDGRGMSDIKQGVTLEVMGEGTSMGPLNETMKKEMLEAQGDIKFEIAWSTLGEYLQHLEDKGRISKCGFLRGSDYPSHQ